MHGDGMFPLENPKGKNAGVWKVAITLTIAIGLALYSQFVFSVQAYDVPAGYVALIITPDGTVSVEEKSGYTSRKNSVQIVDLRESKVKTTKTVASRDGNAWSVEYQQTYVIDQVLGVSRFVAAYENKQKFENSFLLPAIEKGISSTLIKIRDNDVIRKRDDIEKNIKLQLYVEVGHFVTLRKGSVINIAKLHAPDKSDDSRVLIVPPGANIRIDQGGAQTKEHPRRRVNKYLKKRRAVRRYTRRRCNDWDACWWSR